MIENKVYVFNNLIPKTYQDFLENFITSEVPFILNQSTTSFYKDKEANFYNLQDKIYDRPQMVHSLSNRAEHNTIIPSPYYDIISPIFHYLQSYFNFSFMFEVLRSKINLKPQIPLDYKSKFNPPHIDLKVPFPNSWILIYYINNSDGDTILFNERYNESSKPKNFSIQKTVSPQKGRLLFFPADIYHSANFPVNNFTRIIINNVLSISPR